MRLWLPPVFLGGSHFSQNIQKSFASLFKGCGVQREDLWTRSAERGILLKSNGFLIGSIWHGTRRIKKRQTVNIPNCQSSKQAARPANLPQSGKQRPHAQLPKVQQADRTAPYTPYIRR